MLGKALKYEFKATARIFGLMYAALLVLALINMLIFMIGNSGNANVISIISTLLMMLYVIMTAAVIVVTIIIVVIRFYRMLGNEGHLWFTLPVTASQHIFGKLIPAFVWSTASCLVVLISIGFLTLQTGWTDYIGQIPEIWRQLAASGFRPGFWLGCSIALILTSWLYSTLMVYASIAMGPNLIKSRLGGSVLAYLIFYVALQIISTIGLVILSMALRTQIMTISDPVAATSLPAGVNIPTESMMDPVSQFVSAITIFSSVEGLVVSVVFYLIARYFMTRKLNLA